MPVSCKGNCTAHRRTRKLRGSGTSSPYGSGYKRCIVCGYWIKTVDIKCGCCGLRYRVRPRRGAYIDK